MKHPFLPPNKSALYHQLGLIDAPLPAYECGGCSTCLGVESHAPGSYELARHVAGSRLADAAKERAQEYEDARKRAAEVVPEEVEAEKPSHVVRFSAYTREA